MPDSDFWRDLAEKFRLIDPHQLLRADWEYNLKPGEQPPKVVEWRIAGEHSRSLRLEFETLARRGGPKIHPGMDSLVGWLESLREYRLNAEIQGIGLVSQPDGTVIHRHSGSIVRVCEASLDLCKLEESLALETERMVNVHEQQKHDPQNRPFLHRQWEAFKAIRELTTAPPEEIPEAFVRNAIAGRDDIKPEDVTLKQIQLEVAGMLPHYPSIRLIKTPTDQAPVPEHPSPAADYNADPIAEERTRLLEAYKREGKELGIRITDLMVAKAASKKWNDRTPVQRWKRNDPRCSAGEDAKIRSILKMKPHIAG